jgi:hypothetical protein
MRTGAGLLPAYVDTNRWDMPDLAATAKRLQDRGTYTPTYTATTTTPVLGSTGFIRGTWTRIGLRIAGWIDLSYAGTGVVFGGTAIQTGLPFPADLTVHQAGALAAASARIGDLMTQSSVSADAKSASLILSGASTMLMYGDGSTTSFGGTIFTGTTGRIKFRFRYMAAATAFP